MRFQGFGGLLDVLGGCRGFIGVGFDAGDVVGNVLGALRRELRAAGDLLRGGALLLDRGRDRGATSLTSPMMLPMPLMASMASPATR